MTVIRTFISHADEDKKRIEGILRNLAPFGVRPWLDREELMGSVGGSLSKALREGILQECQSMILFLSENSVRSKWVEREVESALTRLEEGFRILPIYLDDADKIDLSAPFMDALRLRSSKPDTLYLKVDSNDFYERVTASVFSSCDLDETQEIVLHLGYRLNTWSAQIPEPWRNLPALDIRLSYPVGCVEFSPTAEEWQEIQDGLKTIRSRILSVRKVRVCGSAPLGVGALVGHIWDRGTNVQISAWNERERQEWSGLAPEEEQETNRWSPEVGKTVVLQNRMDLDDANGEIVIALMPREDHMSRARQWSDSIGKPLIWMRPPDFINNPEEAKKVLIESIGAIRWIARTYPKISCMNIVTGLPIALVPPLVQQLKRTGKMRFFDQIYTETDPSKMYREAASWT